MPGSQVACACVNGAQGAQKCNASGTGYDPCECPDAGAGGTGGTSGSGGTGGTSGSGGTGGTSGSGGTGGTSGSGGGPTGSRDTCPGADLAVDAGTTTFSDTLAGTSNDYDGNGHCIPGGGGGADLVYHVVPTASGTLSMTVTPSSSFSVYVYYTTGTCSPASTSACKSGVNTGNPVTITLSVTQGQSYYVVIDSYSGSSGGPFDVQITLG